MVKDRNLRNIQLNSVQLLSRIQLFATQWTAAYQASLSITNSYSLLKLMSIKSVMLSNHLILCHPLLLLPSFRIEGEIMNSSDTQKLKEYNNTKSILKKILKDLL